MEGSNDVGGDEGGRPPNDSSLQALSTPGDSGGSTAASSNGGMNQELPFLVTHWLANFHQASAGTSSSPHTTSGGSAASNNVGGDTAAAAVTAGPTPEERDEAMKRLRRAAGDIASAFSTLGIFGSATSAPLSNNPTLRNATYSDVARRWPSLPPTHLETVAESSVAATAVANQLALDRARPVSVIDEKGEGGTAAAGGGRGSSRARRVGEGSARPNNDGDDDDNHGAVAALASSSSILHPPTLLTALQSPPLGAVAAPSSSSSSSSSNPAATNTQTLSNLTCEFATALGKTLDQEREESIALGAGCGTGNNGANLRSPPPPARPFLPQRLITAAIGSDLGRASTEAAVASRRVTDLRCDLQSIAGEISSIERTISSQERTRDTMTRQREVAEAVVDGRGSAVAAEASRFLSQGSDLDLRVIDSRLQDAERVIAQMGRKLTDLKITQEQKRTEYGRAAVQARDSWRHYGLLRQKFHDPFARMGTSSSTSVSSLPLPFAKVDSRSGSLLSTVIGRQHSAGGSAFCHGQAGRVPSRLALKRDRKSILQNRLSHAVTISCHLFYPIFSLKFDKTGKYFITGADDHLVKLFHLGAGISSTGRNSRGLKKFNYGANDRGAVLVCTLRGHAGVVTDVDVSADNALLATASEDGDVRIWGLKDGSPVAILRGHTGGANMVSWSALTPYRIVTTGDDGLARMWDIREAALKRYGSYVGKRSDYTLPKIYDYESSDDEEESENAENSNAEDVVLPPIPLRAQEAEDEGAANVIVEPASADGFIDEGGNAGNGNVDGDENRVIVPPLPAGAGGDFVAGLVGAGNIANNGNGDGNGSANGNGNGNANGDAPAINPGAFVAGDEIDEGVRLISKLQHGEVLPDNQMGTRSQRKTVQVVCITRCPIGGHFATGSDDGLGRVWADEDDERVEQIDARIGDPSLQTAALASSQAHRRRTRTSGRLKTLRRGTGSGVVGPSRANLLATLAGHLNSITDIEYSGAGDRILTASQKDGVVRIWAWGNENAPASNADAHTGRVKFDNIKQILIRLTNPAAVSQPGLTSSNSSGPSRRRGGSSSGGSDNVGVYCDSAKWTSDDSKIVTSQACLIKEGAPEIVPDSQVIYVWHSRTGQCLLGMPSAHSFSASVLLSHPLDASILVSAGGDGRINVWDLDTGKKFFTHHNTLTHGPIEPPSSRGKDCAYLDGHFSPDGLNMVLTDDNGRVTILDTLCSENAVRQMKLSATGSSSSSTLVEGNGRAPPGWMKEQYCANDYYEMIYDAHGYCIERGSGYPPHLAPKAARCTHTGTPHPDEVTEAFNQMAGPLPIPEAVVRLERDAMRLRAGEVRKNAGLLYQNVQGKRTFINVHSVDVGRYGVRSHVASVLGKMGTAMGGIGDSTEATENADDFGTSAAAARAARSPSQRRNGPNGGTGGRVSNRASSSSGRALSSNYEWGDYDDLINERPLSDEGESEDEEYNAAPRARGRRLNGGGDGDSGSDSSDDAMDVDSDDGEGGSRRRRSRRRRRNDSQSSSRSRRRSRGSNSRRRSRSIRFDDEAPTQPSRTSSRQQHRSRRVYDVPDSDDDDLVEMMSTNTTPTGEYVDDYNVLGHLFKLPEGGRINRAWVTRMESHLGLCGKKKYAPQVGDSVVYIPKAHYDTVKEYPTGNNSSAPWKSWPKSSAWPVVRCTVKDIRYRFPYEQYYRSRGGDAITSVVAILKLEVTGIPLISSSSDSSFPWPKPEFISRQTRSSSITFEVSLFENEEVDFIVPEHLYIWKIKSLEDAISSRRNAHGLQYTSYFQPSGDDDGAGVEDAEFIPYGSEISDMVFGCREREIHFQNSGYNAFGIVWETGDHGQVSAWEGVLTEKVNDSPPAPSLEDDEKAELLRVLDKIEEDPFVESCFSHPVDTDMFTDYHNMIEVPMDLSIIRTRLQLNYYTNVLSAMADVRLIRDNCIKYNERNSDITEAACDLYNKFEDMSSDLREKAAARLPIPSNRRREDADDVPQQPSPSRSTRTSRRAATAADAGSSSRLPELGTPTRSSRRSLRSSLESLPPPLHEDEESDAEPRSSRRRLRINLSASSAAAANISSTGSTRPRRPTRGAIAATEERAEEENGSSDDDEVNIPSEGRRRSTRSAAPAAGASSPSRPSERTSTRTSPQRARKGQNVSYEEVDSDADEQESPAEEDSDGGEVHESESSEEDVDDEEKVPRSLSQRVSSRRAAAQPSSSRATGVTSSPRSRRKRSVRYEEVESDEELFQSGEEEEEEEKEDEASSEDDEKPTRRGTKRASADVQSRRSSPRRRAASRRQESSDDDSSVSAPSGGESSSEEEDDEQDHSDDASSDGSDEYVSGNRPSRASTKRRKRSTGAQSSAKKKSKTAGEALFYPNLSKWPPVVDIKDFTKIAKKILEVCREADTEQIFASPVTEAFPEVADAYLNAISDPMDFRTIEEERLPAYQDMQELQDDLIQTFRNCCVYNGEGSDFYHYAVSIWNSLNNIFKEVCEGEGIVVPRRWS